MTLSSAKHTAATLLAGLMLSVAPAYGGPRGIEADLAQLTRELDKVGQNLCKSLDLKCRKSKKAARDSRKTKKPGPSPVARPKPVEASAPVAPKAPRLTPVPRPKPSRLASKPPEAVPAPIPPPLPKAKPPRAVALLPAAPQKPVVSDPESAISGGQCLAALRTSNVEFDTVATPVSNGSCLVDVPVRLHAVPAPRGRVVLPDKPILNCRFARQFALWLSDAGAAVVAAQMNTPLAKVSTGPGYECRGRNGDGSAKLSEHAFGNAVDITTIATADGRTIQISDAIVTTSPAFNLLRGLRTTACGYFSTVLGPGADAAHASHFHFDMGLHGKSLTYRVCQ
ncbi:MAG: extensin-like domain-containing protein [Hyphomicrobiales bacterium]